MIVVYEYTLLVYAERELSEQELRDLEEAADDAIEPTSWSTLQTDMPEIVESTRIGVDFGQEYVCIS